MRPLRIFLLVPLAFYFWTASAVAAPETPTPDLLKPWIEWVKDRHPEWSCADSNPGNCNWPGVIRFNLTDHGATFALDVELLKDRETIPLPSAKSLYPAELSFSFEDGRIADAHTFIKDDLLFVTLPKGKIRIGGRFTWDRTPQNIPVPGSYGIVKLDSKARVRRDNDSFSLEQDVEQSQTDHVAIEVARLVTDGSPVTVETRITLKVSGRSRTLDLGRVIPIGADPISVSSQLAAGVKGDGSLVVQLIPGHFYVSIVSIQSQPLTSIKLPASTTASWPKEELLAFRANSLLRSVQIVSGATPSPGSSQQLPGEWQGDSPFVVEKGAEVQLEEIRRGEQSASPDVVRQNRTLWIDLDGEYFTAVDRFTGELNQNFRFDADASNEIGRAESEGAPLMLSIDDQTKHNGVRLIQQRLQMTTVSRIKNEGGLSASGWGRTVDDLNIELNLPPSWKLLHVEGADEVVGSWLSTWSLLTVFITILVVVGAKHLISLRFAAVLAASLILNHGEFLAPEVIFIHILLLIVFATLVGSEESFWRRAVRGLTVVAFAIFALQSVAFAKLQFMQLLYPQLQAGTRYRTIIQDLVFMMENSIFTLPLALLFMALIFWCVHNFWKKRSVGSFFVSGFVFFVVTPILSALIGLTSNIDRFERYSAPQKDYRSESAPTSVESMEAAEQSAVPDDLQDSPASGRDNGVGNSGRMRKLAAAPKPLSTSLTRSLFAGPAIPDWSWRKFYVRVPGPVDAERDLKLYLLSPPIVRTFCAVRTLLSLALIYLMGLSLGLIPPNINRKMMSWLKIGTASAVLLISQFIAVQNAAADVPSESMLQELERRLQSEQCTGPECSVIRSATFQLSGNRITMRLIASSNGVSSIALPGPLNSFQPDIVRVGGRDTSALRRSASGFLELKLGNGVSEIEIDGELPKAAQFSLQFAERPLFASALSPDWDVEGISSGGYIADGIRFIAKQKGSSRPDDLKPSREGLVSWFNVNRELVLGDSFSVVSSVSRLGSVDYPVTVDLPLIEGEKITSGSVKQDQKSAMLTFAAGVSTVSFSSTLPKTDLIKLLATDRPRIAERFSVRCDASLRCEFDGVNPLQTVNAGVLGPVWEPYPGEEVSVKISSLVSPAGSTATVDKVQHEISWGSGLLQGEIKTSIRTTQQSMFTVRIPSGAELTSARLNGSSGDGKAADGAHSFLLNPGNHELVLTYQLGWKPGFNSSVPEIKLSSPSNNITTIVKPSSDRWLLWTGGGSWGPSVVFWGKLIFVCLIGALLGAVNLMPGGVWAGVLLGIGLSSLPLMLIAFPLIWLALLSAQDEFVKARPFFNATVKKIVLLGIGFVSLLILYRIVQIGLVLDPPMLIVGNQSAAELLRWYVDHASADLPTPFVLSLPLWCWRVFSLIWAGWLVSALIGWLKKSVEIFKKI